MGDEGAGLSSRIERMNAIDVMRSFIDVAES